jgi:cytochrome d ubiquinol oxidase subunit II
VLDSAGTAFSRPGSIHFPLWLDCSLFPSLRIFLPAYLTVEAEDPTLQSDFRTRALISGVASIILAAFTYRLAGGSAHGTRSGLLSNPCAWLIEVDAVIAIIAAFYALWTRHYLRARIAPAAQVTFILLGWGIVQFPYLVRPEINIYNGASPANGLIQSSRWPIDWSRGSHPFTHVALLRIQGPA